MCSLFRSCGWCMAWLLAAGACTSGVLFTECAPETRLERTAFVSEVKQEAPDLAPPARQTLTVAADPNNLPFSNDREEGFDNKVARLIADDLGRDLQYVWHAQRRGFFRKTMKEGVAECCVGVPTGSERVLTTRPYYRSTFVFVTREDRTGIASLDDPRLKGMKIGVQIIGDDGNSPPPALALGRRGYIENLVGYSVYGDYREQSPPARIVSAVAMGDVDVAVVWGPLAAYFARESPAALSLTAVAPVLDDGVPLVFDISVGVRKGDTALRDQVDEVLSRRKADIDAILDEYHVPRGDPSVQLPAMGNDS